MPSTNQNVVISYTTDRTDETGQSHTSGNYISPRASRAVLYTLPFFSAASASTLSCDAETRGICVGLNGRPLSTATWYRKIFMPDDKSSPILLSALLAAFFVFSS